MRAAVTIVNLVTGSAYVGIGGLIVLDLVLGWRTLGLSRFGAALAAIAFTCGLHHVVHAVHVGVDGHGATALDFVTVMVGIPFGAVFFYLRLEALMGGSGDRFRSGRCWSMLAAPTVSGMYLTGLVASAVPVAAAGTFTPHPGALVHFALALIYVRIGSILVRTQLQSHRATSEWSLSGCSMAGIFLTCAVMHAATILAVLAGDHDLDVHNLAPNLFGVPAGLYFLSTVKKLQRAQASDWNVVEDIPVGQVA